MRHLVSRRPLPRHFIGLPAPRAVEKVSVLAITRGGLGTARRLLAAFPTWTAHAPAKLSDGGADIEWFDEPTSARLGALFRDSDALVCLFSLGAVIRLAAPHMRDKRTDPAVVVVDEAARYAISALSGHLGGANELASGIAGAIGAEPVITTAADVKSTIPVDMVGRRFGWSIEDDSDVTRASACMVNGERVGLYQDAGRTDWWEGRAGPLPANVTPYDSIEELEASGPAAVLAITDRIVGIGPSGGDASRPAVVVYRPGTLAVGIGLHRGTTSGTVLDGIRDCLASHSLSLRSIACLASMKRDVRPAGLEEAAAELAVPVAYVEPGELAGVKVPNPSETVRAFEGTPSVSEAAALTAASGLEGAAGARLAVEKQKYPPDLTVAVARSYW